jgi:hypothetical protein
VRVTLPPFFWPAGSGTEPAGQPPAGRTVLGHDGTRHFLLMPDGTVAWVDPAMPLATHFVNSSQHHFEASLEALVTRRAELERADADGAIIAVSSLRHDLNRIDISALGDRDNFWAVVLDKLEDEVP